MKLVKFLDQAGTRLSSDLLNQRILRELVMSEFSATGLSRRLDVPVLKLWRRIQKLETAGLIEVSSTLKSGNIEKKLYRATATNFIPQQFLEFEPKDPQLSEVFEIYSGIHKKIVAKLANSREIPKDADPVDYSIYASMKAFAEVCGEGDFAERISRVRKMLSEFKHPVAISAR